MHAHQPRKRSVYEIAKNFLNDLCTVNGGEYLNEPMNQSLAYNQIKNYEDISKKGSLTLTKQFMLQVIDLFLILPLTYVLFLVKILKL